MVVVVGRGARRRGHRPAGQGDEGREAGEQPHRRPPARRVAATCGRRRARRARTRPGTPWTWAVSLASGGPGRGDGVTGRSRGGTGLATQRRPLDEVPRRDGQQPHDRRGDRHHDPRVVRRRPGRWSAGPGTPRCRRRRTRRPSGRARRPTAARRRRTSRTGRPPPPSTRRRGAGSGPSPVTTHRAHQRKRDRPGEHDPVRARCRRRHRRRRPRARRSPRRSRTCWTPTGRPRQAGDGRSR